MSALGRHLHSCLLPARSGHSISRLVEHPAPRGGHSSREPRPPMQTKAIANGMTGVFLFSAGMIVGLAAFLLIGSALHWIEPVWWGGEALIIPVIFGVLFTIVGALPLFWIARILLGRSAARLREYLGVGFMVGFGLLAVTDVFGVMLRDLAFRQSFNPMAAVATALAMSGVACVVVAAIAVRFAVVLAAVARR